MAQLDWAAKAAAAAAAAPAAPPKPSATAGTTADTGDPASNNRALNMRLVVVNLKTLLMGSFDRLIQFFEKLDAFREVLIFEMHSHPCVGSLNDLHNRYELGLRPPLLLLLLLLLLGEGQENEGDVRGRDHR